MEMKPRILVTGGSGLLGAYMLRWCKHHGYDQLTATVQSPDSIIPADLKQGIEWRVHTLPELIESFDLLKEKDWAIKLGIIDSILGISICILLMLYPLINTEMKSTFRIEIIFLIPYLLKLLKIKSTWENTIQE